MDSEIETEDQVQRPKDPLRHFLPLEVPSFRGEQPVTQRSIVVSFRDVAIPKKIKSRPGAFLHERRTLPINIQAQMASGPDDYSNLCYRGWDVKFDEETFDELIEDKTQSDVSRTE